MGRVDAREHLAGRDTCGQLGQLVPTHVQNNQVIEVANRGRYLDEARVLQEEMLQRGEPPDTFVQAARSQGVGAKEKLEKRN